MRRRRSGRRPDREGACLLRQDPLRDRSVADLLAHAQAGDTRATARLVSLVENRSPRLRDVTAELMAHVGTARTVGVTGSPGVGKSTLVTAMVGAYRKAGARVGVLAVDPSSPFTGGAVLGDRVRMQEYATDAGVFIRSMASRGHLGGLSWATPQALRVLDAVGFDVVVIETVGVGQSEVEVASLADTTIVAVAPGMGDGIQAAKAGILEVGDVFVVNKADREGASNVVRDLTAMLRSAPSVPAAESAGWVPPVLRTIAHQGSGVDDVVQALDAHAAWLTSSGRLQTRRRRQAREEIESLAQADFLDRVRTDIGEARLDELADGVASGHLDPYSAADRLLPPRERH